MVELTRVFASKSRRTCSGRINTSVLTDPYFLCKKDFVVVALCADGKVVADFVQSEAKGRDFFLSCW